MKYSIILLLHLSVFYSNAQVDILHPTEIKKVKNEIGFKIGYSRILYKDLVFSPLNYSGGGMLHSLVYTRTFNNNKSILISEMNFSWNLLNTTASEELTCIHLSGNFEIGTLHRISSKPSTKTISYLGVSYISDFNNAEWPNYSSSHFFSHSVAFKGMLQYKLKPRHKIQTTLTWPVAHILVRPPYNGFDKSMEDISFSKRVFGGEVASINKYLAVFWETTYKIQLSPQWNLCLGYSIKYRNVFEENRFIQFNNFFSTSINFKF